MKRIIAVFPDHSIFVYNYNELCIAICKSRLEKGEIIAYHPIEITGAEIQAASAGQHIQEGLKNDFGTGFTHGFKQGVRHILPNDKEVANWFTENIDADCSASSAIYKFRLWLKEKAKEFSPPLPHSPQTTAKR